VAVSEISSLAHLEQEADRRCLCPKSIRHVHSLTVDAEVANLLAYGLVTDLQRENWCNGSIRPLLGL